MISRLGIELQQIIAIIWFELQQKKIVKEMWP